MQRLSFAHPYSQKVSERDCCRCDLRFSARATCGGASGPASTPVPSSQQASCLHPNDSLLVEVFVVCRYGFGARLRTTHVGRAGCSKGLAMAFWQGSCLHERLGTAVTAFATHSTGLELKGDRLKSVCKWPWTPTSVRTLHAIIQCNAFCDSSFLCYPSRFPHNFG